ncbi:MAG: PASTA domain-containing protein [Terriglobales bacterium]
MRRFFRLLLLTLVLAVVFLVSAMTSMRMAIHGREVPVPKLMGMTPAQAERIAVNSGLLMQVESRFYSAEVPEGRILSQLPQPGTKVRRGSRVRVAESLGPQRVAIPNVVGQSPRAAQMNLGRRGLELGSVAMAHLPDVPPDQVVAQSPLPNAEGVSSPKINLLVSAPAEEPKPQFFVMPDFVGRPLGESEKAVMDAGFKLGQVMVVREPAPQVPEATAPPLPASPPLPTAPLKPAAADIISKQTPVPGQKIPAGTTISFEVIK